MNGKWGGAAGGNPGESAGLDGGTSGLEYVGTPPYRTDRPDPGIPARIATSVALSTPFRLVITGGSRSGPADVGGT